ncbi:MAG: signal peptidase I [Phycisphaerae bacterium]|nr:signal peptidase I [Phycisphaerae bacterium]
MNLEVRASEYPNRRRPWTAVCLSLVMPGLGQIYCGDMASGIVIILLMTMFSLGWVIGIMHENTPFWPFSLASGGVILLATAFAAIDACRRARRSRFDYPLKEYNHWGIYVALVWIAGAGTLGYTLMIKQNVCEAFRVPTHSMVPTIMAGDRVLANKLPFAIRGIERGDVVLFNRPDNQRQNYIKRVVAMGGDTVEIKNGQLFINGQALDRAWVRRQALNQAQGAIEGDVFWETNGHARYQIFLCKPASEEDPQAMEFGPVTVPAYHCFVLGDNRNGSFDSRHFGTLSYGAIRGKFLQIYWPSGHRAKL